MRLQRNTTEQNKQIKCKKSKKKKDNNNKKQNKTNKTKKVDIERMCFKCRYILFQDMNKQI